MSHDSRIVLHGRWSAAGRDDILTLPWCEGPCPGDPWLAHLLPHRDLNADLLARLAAGPVPAGAVLGLMLAAPVLDVREVAAAVRGAGLDAVAAFPGVGRLTAGDGGALVQAGLGPALEAERLAAFAAQGLKIVASSWDGTVPERLPDCPVIAPRRPAGGRLWLAYEPRAGALDALPLIARGGASDCRGSAG